MSLWWWVGFNALVLLLLVVDLGIFHREAHEVKPKEAAIWSGVWITLALLFNLFVYYEFGAQDAGATAMLLGRADFGDLMPVALLKSRNYYEAGGNRLTPEQLWTVLGRARDRRLKLRLVSFDPNGLGVQTVAGAGIEVDAHGNPIP